MWPVEAGRRLDNLQPSAWDPIEVLYDLDFPRLFTCKINEDLHLAYWHDEDATESHWWFAPTTSARVEAMKDGLLSLREALFQPMGLAASLAHAGQVLGTWRMEPEQLPDDSWPQVGSYLNPAHKPFLSIRLEGPQLKPHHLRASVLRRAADAASQALKPLVERAMEQQLGLGRPADKLRAWYDLPIKHLAYGSFEVALDPPSVEEAALFHAPGSMAQHLTQALDQAWLWLEDEGQRPASDEDFQAMLLALKWLTPPQQGPIQSISVGGQLLATHHNKRLTRAHAKRVSQAWRRFQPEAPPQDFVGLVRELDKDLLSFILRSQEGLDLGRFEFAEEWLDDFTLRLKDDTPTRVSAHKSSAGKSKWTVHWVDSPEP